MGDASYDAIVIGGGHHGLIVACYLQRDGMKTAIFERQTKLGGAVSSEEGPVPGFTLNPCAHWSRFYSHPAYTDFNLRDKGLEYIFPDGSEAMIFDNDTCLVGYSALRVVDPVTGETELSHENFQKTLNEIGRFSKNDAGVAEDMFRRYQAKWKPAFGKYRMNPPVPWGKKNALEELFEDPKDGIEPVYQFMTCQQIAYDLFESEELRTLFMRAAMTSLGATPHDVIGLYGFIHSVSLVLSWEPAAIAKGGSQSISNALKAAFTEMGGEFFVRREVTKIQIENGRARGIRLKDGSEIKANKLVVSDLSATQTVCQLLGEEYVGSKIFRRARNIRYDRHNIVWANLAVHELPEYKATCFNPDLGPQPRIYIGPRNADVGWGQTKASYAICHPGARWPPGTLAQALIARSNQCLAQLIDDLDIDFNRSGELVLAFNDDERAALEAMKAQGEHISVEGLEILTKDEIRRLEPSVNSSAIAALHLPTAGVFNPFELVFAFFENARENGVKILTETAVTGIASERGRFIIETDQGEIRASRVINAAGLHGEEIASMLGATNFKISYATKATCFLLDKSFAKSVHRIITGIADLKSFTKFELLMPTYGGNLLMYTPISVPAGGIDDRALEEGTLDMTIKSVRSLVPELKLENNIITAFAGLSARNDRNDFIIETSPKVPTFVNVALPPPGITCAPVIGIRVVEILKENGLELHKKRDFNPCRRRIQSPRDLSVPRIEELLKKDPGYGRVVCRCEKVTEGEIVEAVRRGASTMDGIKFRTRAGMGRCQGNYCIPLVPRILARELNQPIENITKKGPGSDLLLHEGANWS